LKTLNLLFVFWSIFSSLNLWAVTETTTTPNSCGAEYTISGLDGISTSSNGTNYYVGSYSDTKTIYLKFTPSVDGDISMSEGIHPYGSSMQVKFYVGTTCGGADIVASNANGTTHGPFSYSVVSGNTYYVEVLKKDKNYMRYSLTYTFIEAAISYITTDEVIPTIEANATAAVCGSFEDVLQTRNNPSSISHVGGGSADIYNSTDCTLNTGIVDFGTYQHLNCDGGDATATGTYSTTLNLNYVNVPAVATISSAPSSSVANQTVTSSQTLVSSEYNQVEIGTGSFVSLAVDFSALRFINTLNFTKDNTVTFSTPTPYNLEIGSVGIVNNGSGNSFTTSTIPKNIKINSFSLPGKTSIDFEALQTIKIETLEIGRAGTSVLLKAPYVQINSLHQTNTYGGTSTVEIHADYIDIGSLALDQEATIIIKPYTTGKRVLFKANSITASSSSTMIVDSGNYYTTSFDIPGSTDVSSIRATDNNQIINFYINGDFKPGNDPGINSTGNNGNFGTLPPNNFMLFVSGDLETGGGGTTFNATVYVEGSASFGSPSYLKGALSSGGSILIGQNSAFYYDQDIANDGWGSCGGGGSTSGSSPSGSFNLIETNTILNGQDPVDETDTKNDIYTKVINKDFNISLVHLTNDNVTVNDSFNGFVSINIIDSSNNDILQEDVWHYSFVSTIANASLLGQYQINNLNLNTIGKDVKFKIYYIDWDQLLYDNPGITCANHSTTQGNLPGVPSCLNNESNLVAIFPIVAASCLDETSTGAPCESNNHGIGNSPYDQEDAGSNKGYGCALCLLGGGQSVYSRDNFAIRPDKFILSNLPTLPRAGKDYNITVTAAAYNQTTAETDYTAVKNELSIGQTIYYPDGATSPTLNGTLAFSTSNFTIANGTASDVGVTFDDVGKVDMNITDANWTVVDTNDTVADCSATGRLICGDANVTFIPEHFKFTTNSLGNHQGLGFTYISSDLNISAPLSLKVVAANDDDNATKNFNSTAWENPVNITFSLVNIPTGYTLTDVKKRELTGDNNLTFDANGTKTLLNTDANVSLNFDRNISVAKNPFMLLGSDVNITTESNYSGVLVTGSSLADTNATFIYGRTHAPRKRFVGATGVDFIYYEAYCSGTDCNKTLLPNGSDSNSSDDPRWFVNSSHIGTSGSAGSATQKGTVYVTSGVLAGTPATANLTYDTTRGYPYKATMENNASSWLIYNKYKATATANEFEVEFVGDSTWAGQHETNATTDTNASSTTNRRTMW